MRTVMLLTLGVAGIGSLLLLIYSIFFQWNVDLQTTLTFPTAVIWLIWGYVLGYIDRGDQK